MAHVCPCKRPIRARSEESLSRPTLELRCGSAVFASRVDGAVAAKTEGWQPKEWEAVADAIADVTSWTSLDIPGAGDPGPFSGSPALG